MAFLIMFMVVVGTSIWLGFDAANHDWSEDSFANKPWKWVVGALLLWIVVFPLYLVKRGRVPLKSDGANGVQGRETQQAVAVNLSHLPPPSAPAANVVALPLAPAGWYPDPHRIAPLRYWSGNAWTEHTSAGASQLATAESTTPVRAPAEGA
jgi:Protein of unknown function (DUF2510)